MRVVVLDSSIANLPDTIWLATVHEPASTVDTTDAPVERIDAYTSLVQDGQFTTEILAAIHGDIQPMTTVPASRLDSTQRLLIAEVFELDPNEIRSFRWYESVAPVGHPDADTEICVVWAGSEDTPHQHRISLKPNP
jgi:hypothetical protein